MGKTTKKFLMENFIKYYKANKNYRKQLLIKWEIKTEEELFKIVGHKVQVKRKVVKPVEEVKPVEVVKPVKKSKKKSTNNLVDYVIAFDTTGSMRNYIADVRKYVKELIPTLLKSNDNLLIKIVAFGDYYDMYDVKRKIFGNAYQVIELTNEANELINFVSKAKDTSGGDGKEFYGLVINKIAKETQWRENSKRVVLLIADAHAHTLGRTPDGYQNDYDWEVEAKAAAKLDIQFDTLSISGNDWYEELSKITKGVHALWSDSTQTTKIVQASVLSVSSEISYNAYVAEVEKEGDIKLTAAVKSFGKRL